ncbi:MAG TPA: radical SAM protein [bacterium]|nr:radical SAM protein [bacterium]HOL47470.1 radical SAM protein [bacterium]HPQ18950.1 radical SAM protein [bacterium]
MKILLPFFNLYTPPLGFGIIIKLLLNRGYDLKVIEIQNEKNAIKRTINFSPDFILISLYTGQHKILLEFIKKIKKIKKYFVIAGGPHCTYYPAVINENDFIDVIFLSEAEEAIIEFFDEYEKRREIPENIKNTIVRKGNEIITNELRPLEQNISKFPFCERRIFYKEYSYMKNYPNEWFITSRGCPYKCSYCFNTKNAELYKKQWNRIRYRTPENVIKEIEEVLSYKEIKYIEFHDDILGLDKKWLSEFSELYRKKINIPFKCNIIPSFVNEEYVEKLVNANVNIVILGIQCYNEKLRKELLNRPITNKQIINAIKILKKYKVKIITQSMLGLPETDFNDDYKTLLFNISLKIDYAWSSIFQPYPSTKIADYLIQKKIWDGDINKIPANFYHQSVLNFDKKRKEKIYILQPFFALTAKFPVFLIILKILLKLPYVKFYKFAHFFFQTFVYKYFLYRIKYNYFDLFKILPFYLQMTINRVKNKL